MTTLSRGTPFSAVSASHSTMPSATKLELQHRLFAALSAMFGREVPLYDKALLINAACNTRVCELLGKAQVGFAISAQELERTGGERHGAIRIGRADEYRWMGRLFACFALEPHCFYDMTAIGTKSQPVIATAFRSTQQPEHRVFTSLLMTDYFDSSTQARIEALLAQRETFSPRAKELIERSERDGGLSLDDADALIEECTERIFKWTGRARDHALYTQLCTDGFKIAADISCFQSHHLNHLTPNTLCMDLYTAAMKYCLDEVDGAWFCARAERALAAMLARADRDFMKLHFKHLTREELAGFQSREVTRGDLLRCVLALEADLAAPALSLSDIDHSGTKESTEGPSADTPVFLRQDSYKALTEPVDFTEASGDIVHSTHTARFGEIEERGYACTPKGRALYDHCLAATEELIARVGAHESRALTASESLSALVDAAYASAFAPFPKTLQQLLAQDLVYARYEVTREGLSAKSAGRVTSADLATLVTAGFVSCEGLRYEDFLPVSAAGIFASNLSQYGTTTSAAVKPSYSQSQLESILGRPIIDATAHYAAVEARSKLDTLEQLGVLGLLSEPERVELLRIAAAA